MATTCKPLFLPFSGLQVFLYIEDNMKKTEIHAPVNWVGGKYRMRKKIDPLFEGVKRTCYCEPFGGAGQIFCGKEPEFNEVYNDKNHLLCNLFRVIRKKENVEIIREIASKVPVVKEFYFEFREISLEYDRNGLVLNDSLKTLIKNANLDGYPWQVVVAFSFLYAQNLSFGGKYLDNCFISGDKGFKSICRQRRYTNKLKDLSLIQERFKEVLVDNLDYFDCIKKYDCPTTLFYCDPPYEVKVSKSYKMDWTSEDTQKLVDTLCSLKGSCVLSCYDGNLYEKLLDYGYSKIHFNSYASINSKDHRDFKRIETVYFRKNE